MSRSDPDAMQRAREAYLRNPAAGFETDCEPRIRELEAEVERLTNKLNENSQNFQIECQSAEIGMLRAEAKRLREALRPFAAADAWNWAETAFGDDDASQVNYNRATGGAITRGDYRRAAAALAGEGDEDE